ncbi:MAG: hypothetical protein LBK53_05405 [Heliobacteriaceae bacterium]|jgi:hypothetical protein|nr:hypothetical protein [Heliobacteriaceae bacterium]
MEISSIRQRIFNQTKHEKTVARASNPFASASFKGNVLTLTTADVFESSVQKNESAKQNKLTYSALVGSLSNFGSKFREKIDSVVAFGSRMKEQITLGWQNFTNAQFPTLEKMMNILNTPVGGNKYAKMPIAEIRPMFKETVANLETGQF